MKFPKLNQTVFCQLTYYFPLILLFPLLYVCSLFGTVALILWAIYLVAVIVLCIRGFIYFLLMDHFFATVRAWRRDRTVFVSDANGKGRKQVQDAVLAKVKGIPLPEQESQDPLVTCCVQKKSSMTNAYSSIEKITFLYSVPFLDADTYQKVFDDAMGAFLKYMAQQPKPKKDKADVCYAGTVIILADALTQDVQILVRKTQELKLGFLLGCAVDCSRGQYFFDGQREPYEMGLTPRPEKDYALDLLATLLFNGHIPQENPEKRPEFPLDYPLDMTLWELLKDLVKQFHEDDEELIEEERGLLQEMQNGEVRRIEDMLYCKWNDSLSCHVFFDESDEEKQGQFILDDMCTSPQKRKLRGPERKEVRSCLEAYLTENGYEYEVLD